MIIVLAVAAVLVLLGLEIEIRYRFRHGWHRMAWRWLTGRAWHGQAVDVTIGGWHWPGHWFWRLTRPMRAGVRTGVSLLVLFTFRAWVAFPQVTLYVLLVLAVCGLILSAGLSVWKVLGWLHYWRWRRPTRGALEERHGLGQQRLKIARNRSMVRLWLPAAWAGDSKERQALVETLTMKTGIEAPEVSWRLAGTSPLVTLTKSEPPPALVTLADVMPYIQAAKPDELVWGLGKRKLPVTSSLSGDSPHLGLSMGSGGGKSIMIRAALAQMLYHGAIALIIDFKQISQHWAVGLPNVSIVRTEAEIHAAMMWLGKEVKRRNDVAFAGADLEGNVHSVVGPRLIIAGEELNAAMKALRIYWRKLRDDDKSLPVRPPALDSMDLVNLMGRQVLMNMMYVAQRLSNKAGGGDGDIRESIGVIALGRYKASTWKMLAEDHPMPPSTRKPGRFHVIGEDVSEVQGMKITAVEARELAMAGTVSLPRWDMPGQASVAPGTEVAVPQADVPFVAGTPPVVSGLVTLSEAVEQQVVKRSLYALRKASQRDDRFPASKGLRATAKLYDSMDLLAWDEREGN